MICAAGTLMLVLSVTPPISEHGHSRGAKENQAGHLYPGWFFHSLNLEPKNN
jgi:hypothetical protein